jgi:hypothetical protein
VRTRLNSALIPGLSGVDGWLAAGLSSGQTYYYALTAVDADGDESVPSAEAAVTLATVASDNSGNGGGSSSSGGGGGGVVARCFIAASGVDISPELLMPLSALALLACLIAISRRRREGKERPRRGGQERSSAP